MECVIFIGLQASGKSTFCKERFFSSHVRINLDQLKTRNRERTLFQTCLEMGQPLVVDNTNPTLENRQRYIEDARENGFRIIGYYFRSSLDDCLSRNAARLGAERIPDPGVRGTYARLIRPSLEEGFDELHYVSISETGEFDVEEWLDDI